MYKASEILKSSLRRHDMGIDIDDLTKQMKVWIKNDKMLDSIQDKEVEDVSH